METLRTLKGKATLLFIALIAIILFATNPTEDQFKDFLREEMKAEAYRDSQIAGLFMEVFARPTAWVLGLTTEKADCRLFTVYGVSTLNDQYIYIGALNHFVRVR